MSNSSHHIKPVVNSKTVTFSGADYVDWRLVAESVRYVTLSTAYHNDDGSGSAHYGTGCTAAGCHTHDTGMPIIVDLADAPHNCNNRLQTNVMME